MWIQLCLHFTIRYSHLKLTLRCRFSVPLMPRILNSSKSNPWSRELWGMASHMYSYQYQRVDCRLQDNSWYLDKMLSWIHLQVPHHVTRNSVVLTMETHFPVRPSHNLTDLSKEALAMILLSGEKRTWLIACWWPVMRHKGFLSTSGCHRNIVKSSEHDTSLSGAPPWRGTIKSGSQIRKNEAITEVMTCSADLCLFIIYSGLFLKLTPWEIVKRQTVTNISTMERWGKGFPPYTEPTSSLRIILRLTWFFRFFRYKWGLSRLKSSNSKCISCAESQMVHPVTVALECTAENTLETEPQIQSVQFRVCLSVSVTEI